MLTELRAFMTEARVSGWEDISKVRQEVEAAGYSDGLSAGERRFLLAAERFLLDVIRERRNGNQGHDQGL